MVGNPVSEEYTIRHLTPDELPLMRGLLLMFGEVFDDIDTYMEKQPDDDYLRELLGNKQFIALAAVSENRVVGGLAAYELKKFEQERSEIYIYDLAVYEEYRRKGIATALIMETTRIGASRGAYTVFVQADTEVEDEPAIALYSSLGTREEVLHFDIPVHVAK